MGAVRGRVCETEVCALSWEGGLGRCATVGPPWDVYRHGED